MIAWRSPKWAIALLGVTVSVVAIVLILTGGQDDSLTADRDGWTDAAQVVEELPEKRCVDLWNSHDHPGRTMASNSHEGRTIYASVGFDADFDDKCLVTLAYSDSGSAFQFIEDGGGGSYVPRAGSIPVSALDEYTKAWNSTVITERGTLTYSLGN